MKVISINPQFDTEKMKDEILSGVDFNSIEWRQSVPINLKVILKLFGKSMSLELGSNFKTYVILKKLPELLIINIEAYLKTNKSNFLDRKLMFLFK